MFCKNCGQQLEENQVCQCQAPVQPPQAAPAPPMPPPYQAPPVPPPAAPQYQAPQPYPPQYQQTAPSDNRKLYSILSYVFGLWLIGMFAAPEKDDPRVRFNVGQGMILTIAWAALAIGVIILTTIVGAIFNTSWYGITVEVSIVSIIFSWLAWLGALGVYVWLMLIGILGVQNDREKPLPIIGKLAFYR